MKNKKLAAGIVGLAAVAMVGGTLAYFNQTMTAENKFDTGKYGSTIVEEFKPEDGNDWKPGVEVNKDVEVVNTGDQDVVVRVKFDETWVNKTSSKRIKENNLLDGTTMQDNAVDGLVEKDGSVVELTLNGVSTTWLRGEDGWYYFKDKLAAGATTDTFLDSVKLIKDADLGLYVNKKYYTKETEKPDVTDLSKWTSYTGDMPKDATFNLSVTEQDPSATGYSNADYTLKVTAQTVQATTGAVTEVFGAAVPADCLNNWNLVDGE